MEHEDTTFLSQDVGLSPHIDDQGSENVAASIAGQTVNDGYRVNEIIASPLNTIDFNPDLRSSDDVGPTQVQLDILNFNPWYDENLGLGDMVASAAGQNDDEFMTGPQFLWNLTYFNQNGPRRRGGGDINIPPTLLSSPPYLLDPIASSENDVYAPSTQMNPQYFNDVDGLPANHPPVYGASYPGTSDLFHDEPQGRRNVPSPYSRPYCLNPNLGNMSAFVAGENDDYNKWKGEDQSQAFRPSSNTFNRQDIPGADGGHSNNSVPWLSFPIVMPPGEEGDDRTNKVPCLSPPDGTQDVPREEGSDSTSKAPSVSPHRPLTRNGKATDFICHECKKAFSRKQELSRHLRQTKNHGGPTKQCRLCGKLLSRDHTLRDHTSKCKGK